MQRGVLGKGSQKQASSWFAQAYYKEAAPVWYLIQRENKRKSQGGHVKRLLVEIVQSDD